MKLITVPLAQALSLQFGWSSHALLTEEINYCGPLLVRASKKQMPVSGIASIQFRHELSAHHTEPDIQIRARTQTPRDVLSYAKSIAGTVSSLHLLDLITPMDNSSGKYSDLFMNYYGVSPVEMPRKLFLYRLGRRYAALNCSPFTGDKFLEIPSTQCKELVLKQIPRENLVQFEHDVYRFKMNTTERRFMDRRTPVKSGDL